MQHLPIDVYSTVPLHFGKSDTLSYAFKAKHVISNDKICVGRFYTIPVIDTVNGNQTFNPKKYRR